ncbi:RfeD [Microsporum canis CBS 113480]|uniref:RfeD n=1 Tax=Arthroderma otae (strain ATCC MYA-4605 / CBS 113480) TaxID=554155 RepID=C5FMU3_ARTOC|nr:RfeD [Microsporum canis CBS 113480]EEQ31914.1 RfeD [Microsporum canis CBS 113480]
MPRPSLTSSFSVSDATNEVVCPLVNNDGSNCRKRCLGNVLTLPQEKRYRSMQEHIRRAHPNHYIPKLPATEESFQLMVNTPPQQPAAAASSSSPAAVPALPAASASAHQHSTAAQLSEGEGLSSIQQLPQPPWRWRKLQQHHRLDWDLETLTRITYPKSFSLSLSRFRSRQAQVQGSMDANWPIQDDHRYSKIQRSRKGSLTHSHSARKAKHDRNRSKDFKDFRDITRRRSLSERKALSAEPQTAAAWVQGKRWEDLIEAATSATEVDDRDITPVPQSPPPSSSSFQPLSPSLRSLAGIKHRSSVPPAFQSPANANPNSTSVTSQPAATSHPLQPPPYTASPLQKAQTPPPFHRERDTDLEPFPSIESSMDVTKPYLSPPRPVTSYPQQQHNIYPHPHPHAHHPLHPLHPRSSSLKPRLPSPPPQSRARPPTSPCPGTRTSTSTSTALPARALELSETASPAQSASVACAETVYPLYRFPCILPLPRRPPPSAQWAYPSSTLGPLAARALGAALR